MTTKTSTTAMIAGVGLALAGRELWKRRTEADLTGQVALITGGSRGLGLAMAREFAARGCRIAICARDGAELARAREDLAGRGVDALTVPCDITDTNQVALLVERVTQHFGRIDILVNNAGIIEVGPVQSMTRQDFEQALATDFWGVLDPILAVLPQMRARRSGRIVNITSIGGKVSVPHLLPYVCAKFAATGLSEGLRAELAPEGIQVTTIVPGLMRTGSYLNAFFKGRQQGEFAWFSLGDNTPGLSISAARAAREIVRAVRRGEAERILSFPANVAARVQGLAPGTTSDIMTQVNRLLPSPTEDTGPAKGGQVHQQHPSRLIDALTILGRRAAHDLNQYGAVPDARQQ